ncbi:pollen-specific leucine-rich repeat extensin-like protein 4 [Iris pallida]|uniref:Pollen-specific leucine-rich repeat extensin-like protein 4 n=1 Tax=Iris pallida TaxID=29817 RepID=A0AAX6I4I6_IRIPA|nr:pollen-specific leucine-rich repeat extensin-like protein 4 [Iris pallida]
MTDLHCCLAPRLASPSLMQRPSPSTPAILGRAHARVARREPPRDPPRCHRPSSPLLC